MWESEQRIRFARAISRLLGWIYTLSWSASFYPQPLLNWRRKSTIGFGVDFPTLNVLGFVCYTISTSTFCFSPVIREQYAARHAASPEPTVQINDVAFAVHAVFLTGLTYSQFYTKLWGLEVGKTQKLSRPVMGIFWGSIFAVVLVSLLVLVKSRDGGYHPADWAWIDVIYTIGYIKLLVTFVKYIPQVRINYVRQSTQGWSIWQILFDITGGVLSITQLVIDSSLQADWSGLTGNAVKMGLGNVSIFFDLIFITQHYILYAEDRHPKLDEDESNSTTALIGESH